MPVKLKATWEELRTQEAWTRWLELAKKHDPELYDWWADCEACGGCAHLDEAIAWCSLQEMPATFNPILTPRTGCIGMACMGLGKNYDLPLLVEAEDNDPF